MLSIMYQIELFDIIILFNENRDHGKSFWCSTNVTKDGFHTWGSRMWGYCSQERACVKDYSVEEEKVKDFLEYTFDTECKIFCMLYSKLQI